LLAVWLEGASSCFLAVACCIILVIFAPTSLPMRLVALIILAFQKNRSLEEDIYKKVKGEGLV